MPFTSEVPPALCPNCGALLQMATDMRADDTPTPGDFSICAFCAAALIWTDKMKLRKATRGDLRRAPRELLAYMLKLKLTCTIVRPPTPPKPGRA